MVVGGVVDVVALVADSEASLNPLKFHDDSHKNRFISLMSVPPRDRLPYCHLFRLAMRQSTPYRCVPSGCAYLNCAPLQAARGKLDLTSGPLSSFFIFSSHAWTIYHMGGIINSFSKGTLIPSHRLQIWHSTPRRRCYELIPLCGRQDAAYPRVTLHAWDINVIKTRHQALHYAKKKKD